MKICEENGLGRGKIMFKGCEVINSIVNLEVIRIFWILIFRVMEVY